jgi:hypothetical protein
MKFSPGILLGLFLCLSSQAAPPPPSRTLSQHDCRIMEVYLHQQGSNLLVESGEVQIVGHEVLVVLQCRTQKGGITLTITCPMGHLTRRPALERSY